MIYLFLLYIMYCDTCLMDIKYIMTLNDRGCSIFTKLSSIYGKIHTEPNQFNYKTQKTLVNFSLLQNTV